MQCKRKGGATHTAHLAEALVHFTTQLGYNSIVLKSDNENSAKALKDKVQKIRSSLGLSTTLQESIPYDHESNGAAERANRLCAGKQTHSLTNFENARSSRFHMSNQWSAGRFDTPAGY